MSKKSLGLSALGLAAVALAGMRVVINVGGAPAPPPPLPPQAQDNEIKKLRKEIRANRRDLEDSTAEIMANRRALEDSTAEIIKKLDSINARMEIFDLRCQDRNAECKTAAHCALVKSEESNVIVKDLAKKFSLAPVISNAPVISEQSTPPGGRLWPF